ncbi:MAG: polysaccharide pyruvyl transferase family protein [Lachnospiraceae bacterium]|nr:polysaccharide pyruvyl transferase family protein [Lachnospiraceae bacterium]
MKIAVVTVYDGLNYGSYLQAFAMQSCLEALGHEVVFVQRMTEEENLALFTTNRPQEACDPLRRLWRFIRKKTVLRKQIEKENQYYRQQFPLYRKAWERFALVSPEQLDGVDCIVCGSDEIWNPANPNIDVPFYTCADFGHDIPKVAVSVSIGNAQTTDFADCPEAVSALREFSAILVRDRRSQEIIGDLTGCAAKITCDPTLLVDRELFRNAAEIPAIEGAYMLVYTYGLTEEESRIIRHFAREHQYRIVSACMDIPVADQVVSASPLAFAGLVSGAACCVTTTFHGTIFSLLFAKRFCSIARYPKIEELLSETDAREHLWDSMLPDDFEKCMEPEVDRAALSGRLQKMRKESLAQIDRALALCERHSEGERP